MIINRTIQPDLLKPGKPAFNPPEEFQLDNSIPVFMLHAGNEDVTKLELIFEAGVWQENTPLQAALANAMLQEGSRKFKSYQIAESFDFFGAYLQLYADYHFGAVSILCLNKHLPKILPVVEELVKFSILPENEFHTLTKQRKQRFLLENEKVKVLAQKKFSCVLFGEYHPYSQTVVANDFDCLEVDSLVEFYKKNYRSNHCRILASGNTDEHLLANLNQYFGEKDWNGSSLEIESFSVKSSNSKYHFVEKPDAIQSAIRTGKLLVKKDHPDFTGLLVLNAILGGYFSSRLMANIREDKGYTYGIVSSIPTFRDAAYFVVATEVDKQYEEATISEIFKEIELLKTTLLGEDELKRVKQYLLGEFIRDFDGPFARAMAFRNINDFGLDYSFYEDYYDMLLTITPKQIKNLANKYFETDSFYTVVAGRK